MTFWTWAAGPEFEFRQADIIGSAVLSGLEYDCIVTLEFLEHVLEDEEVIGRIRPGTRIFAIVPSFPYTSHVRHFASAEEVSRRYGRFFRELKVEAFIENARGKTFFLMDGTRA